MEIPPYFARSTREIFGAAGAAWLERLPALVDECAQRWSLDVRAPFLPLSINYVAPAVRADGTEVVLKLGVPNKELTCEIEALRLIAGDGSVQLFDADADRGILLLERLLPGTPLSEVADDEEATAIAVEVMRRLWRPAPAEHPFPTVARWASGLGRLHAQFGGGTGPFPAETIARAERVFDGLIASSTESMLLHGDFHHWNVLAAGREPWLALDPKGLVGDPGYEIGPWIANRIPDEMDAAPARRTMGRLLDQLAEALPYDRARLADWAFAQFVLSAWWSYEDHGYGWEPSIAKAEVLATA